MSPGDVTRAKQGEGKSVVVALGVWAKRHKDGSIHIHMAGPDDSITTVTDSPKSKLRRHPKLFQNLRSTLIEQGCWPFDDEGFNKKAGSSDEPASSFADEKSPARQVSVSRFKPVPIRGEPLSMTIIRDRGER